MFKDLLIRLCRAGKALGRRARRALLILYDPAALRVYMLPAGSREDALKAQLLEDLRGSNAA